LIALIPATSQPPYLAGHPPERSTPRRPPVLLAAVAPGGHTSIIIE